MSDDILMIDNSTMRAVARCSNEAYMRYYLGYATPEEQAPLKSGTHAHEAEAVFFRGGSVDDALAAYAAGYEAWADENVPPDDRLSYANTSKILRQWFETHPLSKLPFKVDPAFVEIGFAVPLTDDGSIVFCGRMDGVVESLDDHGLYVLEHKHTGKVTAAWVKQYRLDSQLSGYIWAAEQHTGQKVLGAFVNAIEFSRLPASDRKCQTHALPYAECAPFHANFEMVGPATRTQDELVEWRKTAIHLAKRFRDLCQRYPTISQLHKVRTQGKFHGACSYCALHDFCFVGRPLNLVDSMLVYAPWKPFEDAAIGNRNSHQKP